MHLGKKSEESATHRWKLYIKGPRDEDISTFVEKVVFTLHPSFAEPTRGGLYLLRFAPMVLIIRYVINRGAVPAI